MTYDKKDYHGSPLVAGMCILGIILGGYFICNALVLGILDAQPKITMVPCEKVVIVTEKYSQITDSGEKYWITINGNPMRVMDGLSLDRGQSLYKKIPLNTTILIYGESDMYFGSHITKFTEVKNVTKITGSDCINCCHVEYIS